MTAAPDPTHRLVPSQFPPIGLFDTVATTADLEAAMELAGWTNDRLVAERIARLPQDQWVYGRPNSSIVMAAFLHVAPGGMRFNGPDLGAWYAADTLPVAVAEVAHHLRREAAARGLPDNRRRYRQYVARLDGDFLDISGTQPALHDPTDYRAAQAFGESVRRGPQAGILYDSIRYAGGSAIVAYRPRNINDIVQADHFEITVRPDSKRIDVRRITTASGQAAT